MGKALPGSGGRDLKLARNEARDEMGRMGRWLVPVSLYPHVPLVPLEPHPAVWPGAQHSPSLGHGLLCRQVRVKAMVVKVQVCEAYRPLVGTGL